MISEQGEMIEFLQSLTADQKIYVCGHVRPDGDAIGSTLALVRSLRLAGLDVTPLLADNRPAPESYQWLEGFDEYVTPDQIALYDPVDVFIAVDTPVLKRLNAAIPLIERAQQVALIDHHPQLDEFGDVSLIDSNAAACAQIVWKLLQAAGMPIDVTVATGCLTGLISDTGRFMFTNTTSETLQAASEMVIAGANINKINIHLFSSKSPGLLELEAIMLERMMILNEGKVTCSCLRQADFDETGTQRDEAENIINIIRTLKGSDVALLITFTDTSTRVSLRSKTDFNVGAIAERFGGGGHQAAAGVNWPDLHADLNEIIEEIAPSLPGA